jgi:hypothetical protein
VKESWGRTLATLRAGGATEDERVVSGRRTTVAYVKATRRVERDAELFANYGTVFLCRPVGCHLCRPTRRRFSVNFSSSGMNCSISV